MPAMPQFEIAPASGPVAFVRARTDADAVARHLGDAPEAVALGEAEAGTGWREVRVGGQPWGRVRPRDRMRVRRD